MGAHLYCITINDLTPYKPEIMSHILILIASNQTVLTLSGQVKVAIARPSLTPSQSLTNLISYW